VVRTLNISPVKEGNLKTISAILMPSIRIRVELGALSVAEWRKIDLLIEQYKLTRRAIQHDDPFERPSTILYLVQVAASAAHPEAHLSAAIAQHIGKKVRLTLKTILV
jgi:hypothetical protein